jgi:hypothetical protein
MKLWLTKLRISAALDSGKPLPESLRQKIEADPELKRFAYRTQALKRSLRSPPTADPSLHDSIMRAVRGSARREQPRRAPVFSWLAPSAAVAVLAVFFFWMARPRPAPPGHAPLDGPLTVLEMSETMSADVPSMMMAPLSNEWARVNHDVQGTTQILLASLP